MHWNTYAPIYQGEFDSFAMPNGSGFAMKYTIYKKNYSGPIKSLLCSGQPLVQRYLEDNPIPPVKGSEVEIKFLNKDGLTPLSLFYSEEDDTFKIRVEKVSGTWQGILFEGYLVQEDCSEVLLDHTHELSLVFTDNLGLLKNVNLDQGARLVAKSEYYWRKYSAAVTQMTGYFEMLPNIDPGKDPVIGDTMILEDDGGDTIYRITDVKLVGVGLGARVRVYVDLAMPNVGSGTIWDSVIFITPHNIQERILLGDLLKICLQNTGMLLDSYFANYALVKLASAVFTSRISENIYIDCKTFKEGDNYDDLYTILEKIFNRFTATLFQCKGKWKIHRWLELPQADDGQILANWYNPYFVHQGSDYSSYEMEYGFGNDIEAGAVETIVRPLKFVRNTFNFEQPTDMLFNYKLDFLGAFVKEETAGGFTFKYYEALGWQYNLPSPKYFNDRWIRIKYDSFGNEVDRVIFVEQNPLNAGVPLPYRNWRDAGSQFIEVNKGDVIKFSFDWFVSVAPGSGTALYNWMPLQLITQAGSYFIATDGRWITSNDSFEAAISSTDINSYKTISVETLPLVDDGFIIVWLTADTFGSYKNFNFEYIPYMDGRSDVRRQAHTTTLQGTIKNNIDEEIHLDDTVKNYAKGTLFLPTFTNLIQDKTANWQDGVISRQMKLGEIITRQLNLWRYIQRNKIELNLWPLQKDDYFLGMDTAINYQLKAGFFYIFGKLEIDYKANTANGTIYEIFNPVDSETIIEGVDRLSRLSYQFQYLFK